MGLLYFTLEWSKKFYAKTWLNCPPNWTSFVAFNQDRISCEDHSKSLPNKIPMSLPSKIVLQTTAPKKQNSEHAEVPTAAIFLHKWQQRIPRSLPLVYKTTLFVARSVCKKRNNSITEYWYWVIKEKGRTYTY